MNDTGLLWIRSNVLRVALSAYLSIIALAACSGSDESRNTQRRADSEPTASRAVPDSSAVPHVPAGAELRRDASSGTVANLRGENLAKALESRDSYAALRRSSEYMEMALSFISEHRTLFALDAPRDELELVRIQSDELGYHHVRFRQVYEGLPVIDSELVVHFSENDHIYAANGSYSPTPVLETIVPMLDKKAAAEQIRMQIEPGAELEGGTLAVLTEANGTPKLAYEFAARYSVVKRQRVVVDAQTGALLENVSTVANSGPRPPSGSD